jgi:2-succinyl-5-enolpyruvyl-6-hydroxy-3-cyclohexene-1-carboxylate synthase
MADQDILMAAFARGLAEGGVAHVCVSPGSRSTPLALALAGDARVRCWSHIDERSGGFFGLGIAKGTGSAVALLSTSGTAAAEFHPAVIEARHARVPLVILTADRPTLLRECGAGQTIDQIKLYGADAKWFFEAAAGEASDDAVRFFRSLGARAAARAAAPPAGPVHLNVPLSDPLTPSPAALARAPGEAAARDSRPALAHAGSRRAPDPALIQRLASTFRETPEGLIVCGEQPGGEALAGAIGPLARATGYPVVAEATSGLRTGPHASDPLIDAYDALLRVEPFAAAHRPRAVLRFGAMPTSKPARTFLRTGLAEQVCHVLVDPWEEALDPIHAATDVVHADPDLLCRALAEAIGKGRAAESPWLEAWKGANARVRRALDAALDRLPEPFEGRVARDLTRALPDGAMLFVGSSMPIRDLETFFSRSARAVRILANRGANGIDGVVSTALGVASISPGPNALLIGDLSFLHDLGGLLAARRHALRLTVVVINNDGGGIFHFLPQAAHPGSFDYLFATPHGLDLSHAARLFGLPYRRVSDTASLPEVFTEALATPDTRLLEIRTDAKRNVELHDEMHRAAREALGHG